MIAPEINRITRRLEASLEDVLERLEGGTQSGLYMGKRLSRGNLYRLDDKILKNNKTGRWIFNRICGSA